MATKTSNVKGHDRSHIDQEACAWIAQFDGGEPSAEDLEAFREWVNRSARHREAIERLSTLWGELNLLTELGIALPRRPARRMGRLPALALAASVVVAVVGILFLQRLQIGAGEAPPVLYATAVGEQRLVSLADGSSVQLNTASQLRVAYSGAAREVFLLEGEAFFDVAKDPARPFVVYAGGKAVRAVGTAFAVHLRSEDVEVLVTEGLVELSEVSADADRSGPVTGTGNVIGRVKGGQRVRLGQALEVAEPVSAEEISRELAWREGMLSFAGEPLAFVVEEIGRYTPLRIVIDDAALRERRVGGYFKVGDVEAMFDALEAGFDVEVERVDENTARLSARE